MLTFDQAREQLLAAATAITDTEMCSLEQLAGRVLAQDIFSPIAVPFQDNSAMDGFAFCLADLPAKGKLPVSQKVFAGMAPEPLQAGTAVRLFTGSVIPDGADTVVLQEDCSYDEQQLTINEQPALGQHIRRAGEDIESGQQVLAAGQKLDARHTGLLASIGLAQVRVYRTLRVGLLATGDELVMPGQALASAQIYNSNLFMLKAELEQSGFAVDARHVVDDLALITANLQQLAADCDVLISIGGVSVGEADLVKQAIDTLGELQLWKVAMKPGKPLSFGQVSGRAMIGLPGNPVSAFATFKLFAAPYLQRLQGEVQKPARLLSYPLQISKPMAPVRETFMRVQLQPAESGWQLVPFAHQGSGVLSSVVWATGFARIPAHCETKAGDIVEYWPFK